MTKLHKIISKIERRHNKKIDLSLDRTFNLLNKLGNPQNKIKNVDTAINYKNVEAKLGKCKINNFNWEIEQDIFICKKL